MTRLIRSTQFFVIVISVYASLTGAAADRYWVGTLPSSKWSDKANWSTVSGGAGGASVPGPADVVYFDRHGFDCVMDKSPTEVSVFVMQQTYVSTIWANAGHLRVDDFFMHGGTYSSELAHKYLWVRGSFEQLGGRLLGPVLYLDISLERPNLFVFDGSKGAQLEPNGLSDDIQFQASNTAITPGLILITGTGGNLHLQSISFQGLRLAGRDPVTVFELRGDPFYVNEVLNLGTCTLNGSRIEVLGNVTSPTGNCQGGSTVLSLSGTSYQRISSGTNGRLPIVEVNNAMNQYVQSFDPLLAVQALKVNSGKLVAKSLDIGGRWAQDADLTLFTKTGGSITDDRFSILPIRIGVDFAVCNPARKAYINAGAFEFKDLILGTSASNCGLHNLELVSPVIVKGTLQYEFAKLSGRSVQAKGNVVVTPKFLGGSTPLHFTGSVDQSFDLKGAASSFDGDIMIDNARAVHLKSPLTLDASGTSLWLSRGVLVTSATNPLTLGDNVTVQWSSAVSYVSGPITKVGNDQFIFPTGKNGIYLPIGITAPATPTDAFRAEYFPSDPSQDGYPGSSRSPEMAGLSNCDYWRLDRVSGLSSVSVILYWQQTPGCKEVTSPVNLVVARWNGTRWVNEGNVASTVSDQGGVIYSGTVTSFSPFTLGSISAPLPIQVYNLSVTAYGKVALVKWRMGAGQQIAGITIQRASRDLMFNNIGSVSEVFAPDGPTDYNFTDAKPLVGKSYYRLAIENTDGSVEYSALVSLESSHDETVPFSIFPNPATKAVFLTRPSDIKVFDSKRGIVLEGIQLDTFDVSAWSSGTYWVWTPAAGFFRLVVIK